MLISIVVTNFKGTNNLHRCLRSLQKTNCSGTEVIVVDCLTNEIDKWMKENFPSVRVIHFDHDIGPSASHNVGLLNSLGEYVAFLDNDTEVTNNWLKGAIEVLEKDHNVAVVQCKLLRLSDKKRLDRAQNFIDRFGFGVQFGVGEEDAGQYNKTQEVFYADGAAFVVKRTAAKAAMVEGNMFDPTYVIYYDETDFCWRIHLIGYKVVFAPNAVVYHERTMSTMRNLPEKLIFHHSKNRLATLIKNYSFGNMIKYVSTLLILEASRAVMLARITPKHSTALSKAIWWNILHLRNLWRARQIIQSSVRKVPDRFYLHLIKKPNLLTLYRSFRKYYLQTDRGVAVH
jgi:GT2 family glycosyltransferase